jgi:polyhydroxyalkanoate synthesis regulator phasin
VIRRQLEDVDELRSRGEISEEEAEQMEDELVERLMESRRRQRGGEVR